MSVVQEHAHDLLDSFGVGGIKDQGHGGLVSVLDFGTIVGFLPGVWGMLRSCRRWVAKVE